MPPAASHALPRCARSRSCALHITARQLVALAILCLRLAAGGLAARLFALHRARDDFSGRLCLRAGQVYVVRATAPSWPQVSRMHGELLLRPSRWFYGRGRAQVAMMPWSVERSPTARSAPLTHTVAARPSPPGSPSMDHVVRISMKSPRSQRAHLSIRARSQSASSQSAVAVNTLSLAVCSRPSTALSRAACRWWRARPCPRARCFAARSCPKCHPP